jgi:hypothetical protein
VWCVIWFAMVEIYSYCVLLSHARFMDCALYLDLTCTGKFTRLRTDEKTLHIAYAIIVLIRMPAIL